MSKSNLFSKYKILIIGISIVVYCITLTAFLISKGETLFN